MSKIKQALEQKIRRQAQERCGYCLSPQNLLPYKLEIEHLFPQALGGTSVEENLWLACRECNGHKSKKVVALDPQTKKTLKLFNPRRQHWQRHFRFSADGTEIIGKTACGRATVRSLQMNSIWQVTARLAWVELSRFPPVN